MSACVTKAGIGRHRHRDVVLDVQALFGLGQRNGFAHMPQRTALRQVLGDHRIAGDAGFKCCAQHRFKTFA
jgi:hypothetical protein